MILSAMLTSLPFDFPAALHQAAAMEFTHVDVVAVAERTTQDREALADSGLIVCCAVLGRNLPEGCSLDSAHQHARQSAVAEVKRQITDAAQLGATHVYLVPPIACDEAGLAHFGEACDQLGQFAEARMLRLCIEHFPGRTLPTAHGTLRWLEQHEHVRLLLDLGHCLISGENPVEVVEQAGDRLGYVHLDDNDGRNDVHWPLLSGVLTLPGLRDFLAALRGHYAGAIALELNARNADPIAALRNSKEIVLGCLRAE